MNTADIQAFLLQHHVPGQLVVLPEHTPTVEAAARVAGTSVECIVKSILFLADGVPLLVVANGLARIDNKRLAGHLGVSRKRLKLADAPTVLALTGFEVGSMPPFGHRQPLRTLVDRRVLDQAQVFAGGGALDTLLRLDPAEIVRVAGAEVVRVVEAPDDQDRIAPED